MVTARTQVVIDWITTLGWGVTQESGYPLFAGPLILSEPDRSVWITATGGPGFVTDEGSTDAWSFQALVRGPPDDPFEPEAMAQILDKLILTAPFPATVDGVPINHAHRAASPPAPLPVDPNDLRHEFTCSYIFITGA